MIRQLSIFAENKKGAMNRITQILCDAGINMNTLITNDSAEFGIVRMLVSETEQAARGAPGSRIYVPLGLCCRRGDRR